RRHTRSDRDWSSDVCSSDLNSRELDRRSRFTEAILESIPTGVLSIASDGRIQRSNRALSKIFPIEQVERATRLEDLFTREDTARSEERRVGKECRCGWSRWD